MESNERDFLRLVQDAAFSNPFGEARDRLDRQALGLAGDVREEEILPRLNAKVEATLAEIAGRLGGNLGQLSMEDRRLLDYGYLFHTFHRFCDDYDAHIDAQVVAGHRCQPAPFAREVLRVLGERGFAETLCLRYLALFFQMRRAFFFIRAITGNSACVRKLRHDLWNNIFTGDIRLYDRYLWNRMEDFSTMLLGETGTGKGLAAAAIGRSGFIPFNDKTGTFKESFVSAFVEINLAQFPEQLIESELFGHRKGAFTGAIDHHQGIFSRCSPCGAIFLDEIGDAAIPAQIKLLRVLQERHFSPVGSHQQERFAGRVIAATHKDLEQLRGDGRFRDDFYYRLCSDVITVPPLRQRLAEHPGELALLAAATVTRIVGAPSQELLARVLDYLAAHQPKAYPWPGNIRELEQCIRHLLLSGAYAWQKAPGAGDPAGRFSAELAGGTMSAAEVLVGYCQLLHRRHGTYEAVAKITGLDRRTVKKHIAGSGGAREAGDEGLGAEL